MNQPFSRAHRRLEHFPIKWNRECSRSLLSHVLFGKPVSTFPGHALAKRTPNKKVSDAVGTRALSLVGRAPQPFLPEGVRPYPAAGPKLRGAAWTICGPEGVTRK